MSPPDPRSLLAAGRARKPTDADRDRVKSALLARIAAGGAVGAGSLTASALGSTTKTSGLTLTLATKIIGSTLLAAALGAGVWGAHEASRPDLPTATASVLASGTALPPAASGFPAARPASSGDPGAPGAPAASPPVAPDAVAPAVASASASGSVSATGAISPQKVVALASSPGEGSGGRARASREPGAAREGASEAAAPAPGGPGEGAAVAEKVGEKDTLGAEVKQLREARQALQQGRAAQALELLGPSRGGMLAAERAALRVAALCRAGRAAEARREAAQVSPGALAALLAPSLREQCGLGVPTP